MFLVGTACYEELIEVKFSDDTLMFIQCREMAVEKKECGLGELEITEEGICILTVTCVGKDITKDQMIEAVSLIDSTAEKNMPLLVDARQHHSASYGALTEMAKAQRVLAVAIYAPENRSYLTAKYIEQFQTMTGMSQYPFRTFVDLDAARLWLRSFLKR